jgi:hypothetical protein
LPLLECALQHTSANKLHGHVAQLLAGLEGILAVTEDKSSFVGEGVSGLLDWRMVSKLRWKRSLKARNRTFFLWPWQKLGRRATRRPLLGSVLRRALRGALALVLSLLFPHGDHTVQARISRWQVGAKEKVSEACLSGECSGTRRN